MAKRFLIVGAFLATSLLVVGASTALGVVLGTRALVVSAATVKPAAAISAAPIDHAGSPAVLVAMGHNDQ